ncbi:MAG: radical SAM protein [Planctomycetes bacterium]|nr:radical SAM protein [Planctomycetota bacterium]
MHQESFVFELTQRCNHDCLHCYNAWKNPVGYPMGELPTGETLAMLGKMLDETGASLVTLSGGEPMLRGDVYRVVDFLAGRGVAINFITNASLLDEKAVARLTPDKVSIFEVPLLSCERAIHDRMSGVEGAFDRMTNAVAELKLRRERVVGVFVATRLNLPTWRETAELAIALGVDGLMFNRFNPGGRGIENLKLLQVTPAELQAALDEAERICEEYDFPISCSIAMPPCLFDTARYRRLTFGFCAAGTERAYYTLDPQGNVRPCNHSPSILGNIRTMSFEAMAAGRAMRDFKAARPAFCRGCRLEHECLGGCKAAAEAACCDAWAMDPFLEAFHGQARKP